jgi:hypothetical protein
MSVFISYSSKDAHFVEQLASALVANRVHIWLDKWEMQVGDSLLDKIQSALTTSDYLLVVLSKASVESEWCRKELKAGLMRELEEKKTHVIPIIIEDCEIPIFLRDKKYADFRKDFITGLNELLRPLAPLTSDRMKRSENGETVIDYAFNFGLRDDHYFCDIDFVTWFTKEKKSTLIQIQITGNTTVTQRFFAYNQMGKPWLMREVLIQTLHSTPNYYNLRLFLKTDEVYLFRSQIRDKNSFDFNVVIRGVQMGEDNSKDMLVNLSDYINLLMEFRQERVQRESIESSR